MVEDEKRGIRWSRVYPKNKICGDFDIHVNSLPFTGDQASRLRNRNGWTRKRKVFRKILTPYDWLVEDVENIIPRNKRKM